MTSSRTQALRTIILEVCSSRPKGIHGTILWNRMPPEYKRVEFDEQLYYLRDLSWLVCVNKLWWLTDLAKRNWQEHTTI